MEAKKEILWIGSSKPDLQSLVGEAQDEIGYALFQAQMGGKSEKAKPFKGFGSANVLEIVVFSIGGTYRGVYTVRFKGVIAVLHVFHKKSTHGIKTSKQDIELIKSRLKLSEEDYNVWMLKEEKKNEKEKSQ